MRKFIGNVFKIALLGAGAYVVINWESITGQDTAVIDFAKKACTDEIRSRFDVSTVRTYKVDKKNNGYIVRASVTLPRGNAAKVVCLTNENGGVRDIRIDER